MRWALVAAVVLTACTGGGASTDAAVGPDFICFCCLSPSCWDDAGRDLGPDMPHDAGPRPPETCFTGRSCDPTVGCYGMQVCQPELSESTTLSLPDGGTVSEPVWSYVMGTCTNATLTDPGAVLGASGACDPSADPTVPGADGCLTCARCVDLGTNTATPGAPHLVQCAERCAPNATDNDVCRYAYQCAPDTGTCASAECLTDLDCQRVAVDTTGDGLCDGTDVPSVDPEGGHCNTSTYRCERAGTPGAHAGDPCTRDSECEANGRCEGACMTTAARGTCTKDYCNLAGNECATGEKCLHESGTDPGLWRCRRSCTVDAEDLSLRLGAGGHGDTCDPGDACMYDGTTPVGAMGNGGCLPGNYNAIRTGDVAHACTADDACFSPHGVGTCLFPRGTGGLCTIAGCAGYPDAEDLCGDADGNSCVGVNDSTYCLHRCTTDADCAAAGAPSDVRCATVSTRDRQLYCWVPG